MTTWVVQENMLAQETRDSLKQACNLAQVEYFPITLIPFTNELPELPNGPLFFWGTTTIAKLVYPHKGLFYDPAKFSMQQYLKYWNEEMLNVDAKIIELRELCKLKEIDGPWFVRPNDDTKSFPGGLLTWDDIQEWLHAPSRFDNDGLNLKSKIMIGKPLNVLDEIRCYIINGELITASYYRKNKNLHYKEVTCWRCFPCLDCELRAYVKERCREYMPSSCFVMDIAAYPTESPERTKNWDFYIIEAGCINCCGFYDCNLPRLVEAISKKVEKEYEDNRAW